MAERCCEQCGRSDLHVHVNPDAARTTPYDQERDESRLRHPCNAKADEE